MKSTSSALLSLLCVAPPLHSFSGQRLIPAGSVVGCTISEPKLSSKTEAVGDPILCQVAGAGYSHQFGPALLPYETYLVGRFAEYKDPGHFVGKGWMELKFERMVIEPDTVVPLAAKVVGVSGYGVDREGRIHGKGHPVRDSVEWTIPILWPIDVLNLPRRGPRPTLKAETRLMIKIMDDFVVPARPMLQQDPSGLLRRAPSAYSPPSVDENLERATPPTYYPLAAPAKSVSLLAASDDASFAPAFQPTPAVARYYRMPYAGQDAQNGTLLLFRDGRPPERIYNFVLTPTRLYVLDGERRIISLEDVDLPATRQANLQAGREFSVPNVSAR